MKAKEVVIMMVLAIAMTMTMMMAALADCTHWQYGGTNVL